jgi:hypothetical protein
MLATFEHKNPQQESKRHIMQYCQMTSLENILLQKDLFNAFPRPHQGADGNQRILRKPMLSEEQEREKMAEATAKLRELNVSMAGEIKPVEELKIKILSRKIQVGGDLLEYNPLEDRNIPRVSDVFMCVDQIDTYRFMFNIVDKAQKISYTEKEFKDFNDFEISVN